MRFFTLNPDWGRGRKQRPHKPGTFNLAGRNPKENEVYEQRHGVYMLRQQTARKEPEAKYELRPGGWYSPLRPKLKY